MFYRVKIPHFWFWAISRVPIISYQFLGSMDHKRRAFFFTMPIMPISRVQELERLPRGFLTFLSFPIFQKIEAIFNRIFVFPCIINRLFMHRLRNPRSYLCIHIANIKIP